MSYSLGIAPLQERQRAVATADINTRLMARIRYDEAQQEFDAGRYDDALRLFTEAWRMIPHPSVLLAIGLSLQRLGRLQEARWRYERYLRENPSGEERERAQELLAEIQAAMEQDAVTKPSAPPAPAPPPAVPADVLEAKRRAAMSSEQVAQRAPSPRTLRDPYEERATYGVWIATGAGVLALIGAGVWLSRRRKRRVAVNRRRRRTSRRR